MHLFSTATPAPEFYTLSLHDALPICVLEDRRVLDAVGDQLDRGDLRVLPGDHRQALLDGWAAAVVLQGVDDAPRERIGRGEHAVELLAARVVGGQQVLHAGLGGLLLPALGGG